MCCKIFVPISEKENIFVPMNAIYRQASTGQDYVYTINNNVAKRNKIERIYTKGDFVAVSGLSVGQNIVVEGKSKIKDGSKVKVSEK
jgi:membrane fusion protein (multidrug efflux system)